MPLVFVVGLLNWLRDPHVWRAFDDARTTVRFNLQVRERELRRRAEEADANALDTELDA